MNRSKVVLVQPPIEDFYLTKKRTIPHGLACIAACIREKGFDVELFDALATPKFKQIKYPDEFSFLLPFYGKKDISTFSLFHEFRHYGYSFEHIGTVIRDKEPFLVGISSLFTAYSNEAVKTAKTIKKFYPQCKIVIGGHHPTQFPEQVLKEPAIDFVLQGEGENSMASLCQALRDGSDLKQVPGIVFRNDEKTFRSKPDWLKNLNGLPVPADHLINHNFYQRKNRHSSLVVSSRGCPMKCSYCSVSASSSYAPFRQRDVEDVINEIRYQAHTRDIGFIDFEDENLCLNKQWFLRLFSKIKDLASGKNIELRAMNGLYPPAVDEEIIAMMKAAGFRTLNLSLGSTSREQLKRFNRPDVRTAFEKALSLARKYNLECVSYIIAAAPGQTAQCSLNDLLYLAQKRTLAGLSIYYPAPGSHDYQTCIDKKILPASFRLMRSSALPLDDTTSRLQAATLLRLSRILNFMKYLLDNSGGLPNEAPCRSIKMPSLQNRQAVSQKLLQWFLHDGEIRGVQPDGRIYTHTIDKDLSLQFIHKIKSITISGIK